MSCGERERDTEMEERRKEKRRVRLLACLPRIRDGERAHLKSDSNL